jgi:hypothetical protein
MARKLTKAERAAREEQKRIDAHNRGNKKLTREMEKADKQGRQELAAERERLAAERQGRHEKRQLEREAAEKLMAESRRRIR